MLINPFDKTFFKFVLGFTAILVGTFGTIYLVQKYGPALEDKALNIIQNR